MTVIPVEVERYLWIEDEEVRRGVKSFDPSEHPRDNHGRFAEVPGVELPHVMPGQTDAGSENGLRLEDELKRITSSQDQPGWATDEPSVAMKTRNVTEIGSALVERAKNDPALAAQLDTVGQNVLRADDPIAAQFDDLVPALSLDEDGLTQGEPYGYQDDHLHLEAGMTVTEVGAREVAAKMQDAWMQSASNSSPMSWGMQLAAADRMGADANEARSFLTLNPRASADEGQLIGLDRMVPLTVGDPEVDRNEAQPGDPPVLRTQAERIAASPAVKAYVDEVYSRTQKFLADRGIDEVTLYRGVDLADTTAPGETERVVMNPLSSFSTSERTAKTFARHGAGMYDPGAVYRVTVPAARVWSLPISGPGCLNETEAIIGGGPAIVEVYA